MLEGGGGFDVTRGVFISFLLEGDDLTSHTHREGESRKVKTRGAMANFDVGRSRAQIAGPRCENIRNKRNYNRSLWIDGFDSGSADPTRFHAPFHNYPRYRLTVVRTVSAEVVISPEIISAKIIFASAPNPRRQLLFTTAAN